MSQEGREPFKGATEAPVKRSPGVRLPPEIARRSIPTTRSKRTNDPVSLPPSLNGTTAVGRRWKDLVAAYSKQLGPDKMAQEQTRILLSNLVGLTLISERIVGNPETDLSHIIQLSQSIRGLLVDLGLNDKSKPHRIPTLAEYVASREPGQ